MGKYQIVRSKMEKTRVMLSNTNLTPYVPETELFNAKQLYVMLQEFNQVYVKPDCGRGGKRVILIRLVDDGTYQFHYKTSASIFHNIAEAVNFVDEVAAGDQFIIQQGISLLRIDKSPFDLRVNIQKPYTKWMVTAMVAKVMEQGKVVTNYCQGSTLLEYKQALQQAGLSLDEVKQLKDLLAYLGEQTASVLSEKYPDLRELGLDIALDSNAKPWILEVNTKPKYPRGLSKKFDRYRRIIRRNHRYKTM